MRTAFLYVFLCTALVLPGQNLLLNANFEEGHRGKPVGWSQPDGPNFHWDTAGAHGTPHSGRYFNGICISNFEYSEALTGQLEAPMETGKQYHISMWVRQFPGTQATYNPEGATELQVYFSSHRPPPMPERLYPVDAQRLVRLPLPPFAERADWTFLETTYTAQGGETWFALGYFATADPTVPVYPHAESIALQRQASANRLRGNQSTDPISTAYFKGTPSYRTRFYLDDLCVAQLLADSSWDCRPYKEVVHHEAPPALPEKPVTGHVYTIERIYFDFDSTVLRPESFPALDSLVNVLKAYPNLSIEIRGHTDGFGSDAYNNRLSEGRAASVAAYLRQKGISTERLRHTGFGKTIPIAPNDTPENRQKNRRVEFVVEEQSGRP